MDRRSFIEMMGALAAAGPGLAVAQDSGVSSEAIEERVKETLGKMSPREKIMQMSGRIGADILNMPFSPGGHGFTGYTAPNKRLNVPALSCLDGPRGVGFFYKTSCFPVGIARGATWDPELEQRVGEAMGYETAALGANMLLAPCINVIRHPSWGRSQESYGEDPLHLGLMGAAHVTGCQQHVMACPKHYAVNNIDQSRMFVNMIVDERTLREIYLPHFKRCVDAGAASVMSAYNDVNGELCAHSKHLLRDILKGDWGFDGLVISDWINAVENTVAAANAGLDVEMPRPEYYDWKLYAAVRNGSVSMEVIDDAVTRILRQKFRFERDPSDYDQAMIAGPEHAGVAREVARKGMVLLKNRDDLLPLSRKSIGSIAVVGPFAEKRNIGDIGSSNVTPPYAIMPLAGFSQLLSGEVEVIGTKGTDAASAAAAAASADAAVVVCGLDSKDEGEGNDREDLRLQPAQIELIKAVAAANPRTVVCILGGGAVVMNEWIDDVPAVLMMWYAGMEGGTALAEIVFGDVNPSGKLPIVFPKSLDQLFEFDNKAKEVVADYYHGYRYFDKNNLEPAFPFGFGLSYTQFRYQDLRLASRQVSRDGTIEAQVNVTNVGPRAGDEIVQLYVGDRGSKVERPVKELKGFARVSLEPGETKVVALEVKVSDLAYWDEAQGGFVVEAIDGVVMVGPSSAKRDLLTADFSVV